VATILIADDEQPIRTMLAHALQEEGHTLMVAESAEQAKAKSDGYAGGIDLLITNHMLKDGPWARSSRLHHPETPGHEGPSDFRPSV
jgi:DNA-binding response OmpR family regulator